MLKTLLCVTLFSLALCCPSTQAKSSISHRSRSSSKPAYVRGYTRKNGTYVSPHNRSEPGTGGHSASGYRTHTSTHGIHARYHPYRRGYLASGYSAHPTVGVNSHGKIRRSTAAKDAFKRQQPCPANGKRSGPCPGYVIDHVRPLECGGADDPSNMQWQTVADGKAKDKTERYCR